MSDTDTTERDNEILAWTAADTAKDAAVATERDLRQKVMNRLFPTPVKGTQRYELGNGYSVKLQYGLKYEIGDKNLVVDGVKISVAEQIEALEAEVIAQFGDEGEAILNRLIKWSPELSGSEYEKLDPLFNTQAIIKGMIDKVLTIKPNSPQMAFETPKVK